MAAKRKKAVAKKRPAKKYAKRKASAPKRRTIVKRKTSSKMAKKKTKTRRRRSIGAAGGNEMQVIAGVLIGTLGQQFVASKLADKVNPKIIGAGSAVAGYLGAKKLRSPMMKGISMGFAAGGALSLAKSAGIVQGIVGAADDVQIDMLGDADDMGDADQLQYVAGDEDKLSILAGGTDWEDQLDRMGVGSMEDDY